MDMKVIVILALMVVGATAELEEGNAGQKEVLHTRPKRVAITATAAITDIKMISALFALGKGISGTGEPQPGDDVQVGEVMSRLAAIEQQLAGLYGEVKAVIHLAGDRQVETVIGSDVMRLQYLMSMMTMLQTDQQGNFIINQDSKAWAGAVISIKDESANQIMKKLHEMIMGSSPITNTRSILDIYVGGFPKSPEDRFNKAVEDMAALLIGMQQSGYSCWIVALAIQQNTDQIDSVVFPLAKQRLLEQESSVYESLPDGT